LVGLQPLLEVCDVGFEIGGHRLTADRTGSGKSCLGKVSNRERFDPLFEDVGGPQKSTLTLLFAFRAADFPNFQMIRDEL
jgi:hypothetical protein